MRTSLHHLVQEAASRRGNAAALTYKNETVGYADLWAQAAAAGRGLASIGLQRGQRVAVFLEKRIETVTAILGTSVAGGVFVPVNPLLRPAQVGYVLDHAEVTVLITSIERLALLAEVLKACPSLEHVVVLDQSSDAATSSTYAVTQWKDTLAAPVSQTADTPVTAVIDKDPAAILYTSGSTGKPKGVVLSHRNLIVGAESVSSYLDNSADDVILAALPLSFDAGLSQITTAFSVGAHVVLMNYLLARDVVRLCARHGVTGLTCVPPLWIQLAELTWPDEATRRLRYFANTGGGCLGQLSRH